MTTRIHGALPRPLQRSTAPSAAAPTAPNIPAPKDGPVNPALPNRPQGSAGGPILDYEWWVSTALARGSQPTTQDIAFLQSQGYKSILNLRAESNTDQAVCSKLGMKYLQIPWVDKTAPTEAQMVQILNFLTDPSNQPVFMHCEAGENRTGLAVACYRMAVEGWSLSQALTEAKSFGFHEAVQINFLNQFAKDLAAGDIPGYPLPQPSVPQAAPAALTAFDSDPARKPKAPAAPTEGGGLTLFPEPESGDAPIVNAINAAQKSVDLSCYLVEDQPVIAALEAAEQRGVRVRVMLEPKTVGFGNYAQLSQQLQSAGISVEPTPPEFDSSGNVDHAKFMIIDGADLLLGSGNIAASGLGGDGTTTNRDFWLSDTRPVSAAEGETVFNDDWNRQPTTGTAFQNLVLTPDDVSRITALIDSAKSNLLIWNQELSDPTMIQHIITAKERGVNVQVLLATPEGTGPDKNAAAIRALTAAGIPAKEMTTLYLHGKAMVADGQAFIGSQNFSDEGLTKNREVGEIVSDPRVVSELTQLFQQDWATN